MTAFERLCSLPTSKKINHGEQREHREGDTFFLRVLPCVLWWLVVSSTDRPASAPPPCGEPRTATWRCRRRNTNGNFVGLLSWLGGRILAHVNRIIVGVTQQQMKRTLV